MLRFKQYIKNYISEAKAEHFAHIGLDVSNPKHKDMLDMFNKYTHMMPKKNANQYKSLDELHAAVKPHLDNLEKERESEKEHQSAIERGDAELVHHDPAKGVKVFKIYNQRGSCAVGKGTQWCVAQHPEGGEMQHYDPSGEHSHIIHLDKEKGNLSRIGIIGVKPEQKHISGLGGNFQDKGNNTVSDEDWDRMRKKYDLDKVESLEGVRGIPVSEKTKQKIKIKSDGLLNKIKNGTHTVKDIGNGIDDEYLNAEHIKHLKNSDELNYIAGITKNPEVHKAIINHPNTRTSTLDRIVHETNNPDIHRAIINHPNIVSTTLQEIAGRTNDPEVHRAILDHPKADKNVLVAVANSTNNPDIHRAIINHPETNSYSLGAVANKTNNPDIHREIINHPETNWYPLGAVARKTNNPDIHRAIINHPEADEDSLSTIARNSNDLEIKKQAEEKLKNIM